MEFVFNPNSRRAKRARYAQTLGNKWLRVSLWLVTAFFVGLSAFLWLESSTLMWLALWPAVFCAMVLVWFKGDLKNIRVGRTSVGNLWMVHEALDANTLARLKSKKPSVFEVWKALEPSEERYFLNNRYMIDSFFFQYALDKEPGSAMAVWENAERLRQEHSEFGYSNMVLLVAIVSDVPNIEQSLNQLQLDMADVETSIGWMRDIYTKREIAQRNKNFGGIGRDWAYGYTPALRALGSNISAAIESHGFFRDTSMHQPIVEQMVQIMSGGETVTLVGEPGVGKTTCVYAFADRLLEDKKLAPVIRYHQVIELDAPSLIANAQGPGELEQLMLHLLKEASRAKNIILFFDDAEVFFSEGTGAVNLSHILQPVMESGGIRLVLAMNPASWQRLAGTGAATKLQPINVPPADEKNTLAVLRDAVHLPEYKHNVVYTYQALRESYKLGSRYVTNQAMPGAALTILEQAAATASGQPLITREIIQGSVEQAYGIKLQQASGDESTKLLNLEEKLHEYMISQEHAVKVVADALRRSRSGVGNTDRPVGTFLFLGPTGVGKTELSKALARVYFGSVEDIIRVDMNQYVGPDDVGRLIQPMVGSDLGFLGQVRQKPFSVVLLDEIEKAHSTVVNALLQMLDEGTMADSDGKPVSFKDAIIIATSNAGADEIRRMIDEGKAIDDKTEAAFVETLINRGLFAPEFVNRFDEVVIFKPLNQDELVRVMDIILQGINKTLDAKKVKVELTEPAKRWLVDKGFDSRLGARPMRRMTQRYVENIVANRLLDKSVEAGGVIQLDVPDFETADSSN